MHIIKLLFYFFYFYTKNMQRSYLGSLCHSFSTLCLYGCCIFYNNCESNMQIKGGDENLTNKCRHPPPPSLWPSSLCFFCVVWKLCFTNLSKVQQTQHHIFTVTILYDPFFNSDHVCSMTLAFAYFNVCILQFSSIDKLILSLFLLLFSLSYFVVWNIFFA